MNLHANQIVVLARRTIIAPGDYAVEVNTLDPPHIPPAILRRSSSIRLPTHDSPLVCLLSATICASILAIVMGNAREQWNIRLVKIPAEEGLADAANAPGGTNLSIRNLWTGRGDCF